MYVVRVNISRLVQVKEKGHRGYPDVVSGREAGIGVVFNPAIFLFLSRPKSEAKLVPHYD